MKFISHIMLVALLFASTFIFAVTPLDTTALIVTTKQGVLRGTTEDGVYVWKGIRYAKPPVNELRFKLPQPAESWQGVRDAVAYGNIAPQPENMLASKGSMSEDCLFLNVWASPEKTTNKPVMFWIHGGGFSLGAGSDEMYNGSKLCKKGDVIIVSFNYRLGPLGFMYLDHLNNDSLKFENNLGLYDQAAALRWVVENIAAFGGDPNNITIFGESAGANSVLSQMASPVSKGKFQKAIVQSAAAYAEMNKTEAAKMSNDFLKLLNINEDNVSKLLTVSVDSLIHAGNVLFENVVKNVGAVITFAPVYGTDFLPLPVNDAIANGSAKNVSLMIGTNRDEVNLFTKTKPALVKPTEATMEKLMASYGNGNSLNEIKPLYPKYPSSASILSMLSDAIFHLPANNVAATQSAFAPVYFYRFDWTSFPIRLIKLGACHGMELPFVFNSFHSSQGKLILKAAANRKVNQLSEKMQSAWLSFAQTGKPNSNADFWPQYNSPNRTTLLFNNVISLVSDPTGKVRQGWQSALSRSVQNIK
jgi:para-nitrobenzyl esterase